LYLGRNCDGSPEENGMGAEGSPWAMVPTATLGFGASSAVEAKHCGGCWGSARSELFSRLTTVGFS
jgi:hypothetical protein